MLAGRCVLACAWGFSSRLDWAVVDRAAIVMATADRARARLDLPMMMHHGFLPRNCRLCLRSLDGTTDLDRANVAATVLPLHATLAGFQTRNVELQPLIALNVVALAWLCHLSFWCGEVLLIGGALETVFPRVRRPRL